MKRIVSTLLALSALAASSHARADFEGWIQGEVRLPLIRTETPRFPRLDWRVITDVRMNRRSDGIHQAYLRNGPALYVTPWLFIGVQGTIYVDRLGKPAGDLDAGDYAQEGRFEIEPNFFGRIGDFTFNDRNRFEYRYRSYDERTRYRNQLRVNYAPKGAVYIPFVWNEVLIDLAGKGVNQNRLEIGVARMFTPTTRVDFGFMWRARLEDSGFQHDGVVNVMILLDAPPKPAK